MSGESRNGSKRVAAESQSVHNVIPMPMQMQARASTALMRVPVYGALRDRIVRHEIAPGSRLNEQGLADEYDVPRARVREVLMALQERGLVERIPNRGAIVVKAELAQVFGIYQVREVLEGLAARLATQNTDPASWLDLEKMFQGAMQTYADKGDYDDFFAGYELFRQRVMEAAANVDLAMIMQSLYEKTHVVSRRLIILPGRVEQGLKEHRAVIGAMRRGDAEEAERCRRENIRSSLEFIVRYKAFLF